MVHTLSVYACSTCKAEYESHAKATKCESAHHAMSEVNKLMSAAQKARAVVQKKCPHGDFQTVLGTEITTIDMLDNRGYEDKHTCRLCGYSWTTTR